MIYGYEEARRVCYPDTDILLVTFSLVEPDSFSNVVDFWAQEANLDVLKNVPVSQPFLPSPNVKLTPNIVVAHYLHL